MQRQCAIASLTKVESESSEEYIFSSLPTNHFQISALHLSLSPV